MFPGFAGQTGYQIVPSGKQWLVFSSRLSDRDDRTARHPKHQPQLQLFDQLNFEKYQSSHKWVGFTTHKNYRELRFLGKKIWKTNNASLNFTAFRAYPLRNPLYCSVSCWEPLSVSIRDNSYRVYISALLEQRMLY